MRLEVNVFGMPFFSFSTKNKKKQPEPVKENSVVYNNCSFNDPIKLLDVQSLQIEEPKETKPEVDPEILKQATVQAVSKVVAERTGINFELVERVIQASNERIKEIYGYGG